MLARAGLLRGCFIPLEPLRTLRQVSRYHHKITALRAMEKNRLVKVLSDAGIRISAVVSDAHGVAASAIIDCLLAGGTPEQALALAGRLQRTTGGLVDRAARRAQRGPYPRGQNHSKPYRVSGCSVDRPRTVSVGCAPAIPALNIKSYNTNTYKENAGGLFARLTGLVNWKRSDWAKTGEGR